MEVNYENSPLTIVEEREEEKSERFHKKRKGIPTTTLRNDDGDFIILKTSFTFLNSELIRLRNKRIKSDDLIRDVMNLDLDYSRLESQILISWKCVKNANYESYEYYDFLRENEKKMCNVFHILPETYLRILLFMICGDREFKLNGKRFLKTNAQKYRYDNRGVDVNKLCRLWKLFSKFGWIRGYDM
jgi:hypothetical protein